jgi:hypothetical protein
MCEAHSVETLCPNSCRRLVRRQEAFPTIQASGALHRSGAVPGCKHKFEIVMPA